MAHKIHLHRFKSAEKGLRILPSYKNPSGSPSTRMQWKPHEGKKQRLRNLRATCRDVLHSKDPEIVEVIQRAREFVAGRFEEIGMLMMIHQAKDISDSTGVPFVESLDYIIEKLKSDKEEEDDKEKKKSDNSTT